MKILFYGINNSPELTGVGKYTGEMTKWFEKKGIETRVICSPPYYPDWKIKKGFKIFFYTSRYENNIKTIRCPLYVPENPTKIKRIIHLVSFSLSSFLALMNQLFWKPNIIIHVAPSLFCSLNAIIYSKLTGAKSILHIQDFEIDAMFGLIESDPKIKTFVKKLIFYVEKKIYERYDLISTISEGMVHKANQKGIDKKKVILFPNWTELDHFKNPSKNYELLSKLNIEKEKKVVLYSGNMGEKQGLEIIIEAAKELESNQKVHFLLVGEGSSKNRLIEKAKNNNLKNITFSPLLPYSLLPNLLCMASVHLIIQKRGVADSMLPSKLTNIMAVGGNSIITADLGTTLGNLCVEFPGIANLCKPESCDDLVRAINESLNIVTPNLIARNYALKNLDKEVILTNFNNEILRLVN